jgi:hypothetical protein
MFNYSGGMILLLLRIAIAPLIVVAGTLVQRRFGNAVSGLLIGLPLTSLPLLWLVALQHGSSFASSMSGAILVGSTAQVVVLWMYALLAPRVSPLLALGGALIGFTLSIAALHLLSLSVLFASVLAAAGFAVALYWWPYTESAPQETGRYRMILRIVISAGFTLFLVTLAGRFGAGISGLLAALPMMSLVMAFVTHQELGANASAQFLRGVTRGSFSYVASMFVLAELLRTGNIGMAFPLATLVALAIQGVVQSLDTFPSLKRAFSPSLLASRISFNTSLLVPIRGRFVTLKIRRFGN